MFPVGSFSQKDSLVFAHLTGMDRFEHGEQ